MSQVVALIPARSGSKGIPGKNTRELGGMSLIERAVRCARDIHGLRVVVSSDITMLGTSQPAWWATHGPEWWIARPAAIAQDDTPMFDVVKHAVDALKLADDDIIVLLQPTQPFRTPAHVQAAIRLLRETRADSVVSVVELPRTHSPDLVCEVIGNRLLRWNQGLEGTLRVVRWPACRQDARPAYIRDGTVYAFPAKTLKSGTIYGQDVRPLLIPADESCELDTESDWADVERRWRERAKHL
jgi:CMP-N,N'-diacetyllegionaminic acid synthase